MKRNLIALAVSAAVVAPTMAMAEGEVKVYGRAQVEVASFSADDNASYKDGKDDGVRVVDQSMGRIGVLATEDLGGGLTGIAKMEFKIDTADGDASTASSVDVETDNAGNITDVDVGSVGVSLTKRELMVGLKGSNWGQVELGRLKSEYKYKGGVKYDPFTATTLEARGNAGMSSGQYGHNSFNSNLIGYRSPKFGGFSFGATYGLEEQDGMYTLGLKFEMPMFEVIAAAVSKGDRDLTIGGNADGDSEYEAFKVGGQVKLAGGAHKISLQYEDAETTDYDEVAGQLESGTEAESYIYANYIGTFGKAQFVAAYGIATSDAKDADDKERDDATYMAIGAIYKFSKMTRVFGGYRMTDVQGIDRDQTSTTFGEWEDDYGESVISIGLRKDFK
jgi:predicted porin